MEPVNIKVESIRKFDSKQEGNEGSGSIVKAFADISVNDTVLIRGVQVLDGGGEFGPNVQLPQKPGKSKNQWFPIVTLLDKRSDKVLKEVVLKEYNKLLKGTPAGAAS